MKLNSLITIVAFVILEDTWAFVLCRQRKRLDLSAAPLSRRAKTSSQSSSLPFYASVRDSDNAKNLLLDEFRTSRGELIDPYKTLRVSRDADVREIKDSYRKSMKRHHPDGVRFREILPGRW